jgi:hypothetical protein
VMTGPLRLAAVSSSLYVDVKAPSFWADGARRGSGVSVASDRCPVMQHL